MSDEIQLDALTCHQAVARLNEYLDRELAPEEEAAVRRHLAVCEHCFHHFQFEERLLAMIREKCQIGKAPEPLRRKISDLLDSL